MCYLSSPSPNIILLYPSRSTPVRLEVAGVEGDRPTPRKPDENQRDTFWHLEILMRPV
ncbi:MAG: hypothetical protein AAFY26_21420 [Cyanobacteria bacterium J06638_22]